MPEVVKILRESDLVHIDSYGWVTPDEQQASRERLEQLVAQHGIRKVLVDATGVERFTSTLDAFSHSYAFSRSRTLGTLKVAVLRPTRLADLFGLIEDACTRRGVRWKGFTSRQEALAWLALDGEATGQPVP